MDRTLAPEISDGPVMSLINKRLRALRKKHNRILQMEESVAQGKQLNKEQEDVLRSRPSVLASIDELEKLRSPLSAALTEEIALVSQHQQSPDKSQKKEIINEVKENAVSEAESGKDEPGLGVVEDLLNLLYFGSLFDVKSQSDFTSAILTSTHERSCCLTYDYVTDDATDILGERDLDLISQLRSLVISRPANTDLSHKNALHRCIEHAKLWLAKDNRPIQSDPDVTYASLRERLSKILSSHYFTTTPRITAPVEVASAAGNYVSFEVPEQCSLVPINIPVQDEDSAAQNEQKGNDPANLQEGNGTGENQWDLVQELHKDESELADELAAEGVLSQQEQVKMQGEFEQDQRDLESKEQQQQYMPRPRAYQNQRGGRGGGGGSRRGYPNGRGGRGGSRGGGGGFYQNGRNQYYDQHSKYPRNYYNNRGRGGGRGFGMQSYNNYGSAGAHAPPEIGLAS